MPDTEGTEQTKPSSLLVLKRLYILPLMKRLIPSFSNTTLKLMRSANLQPESRKYDSVCASWICARPSTDLTSTTTDWSTSKSMR